MSEADIPEARAAPPPGRDAQPGNPSTGLEWTDTHPNLVFTAPYFAQVPLAEILEPAVTEAAIEILPPLVQPAADQAAAEAVAELAVMKVGDTMSGPLFLSDLVPTAESQAASKHYVDAVVAADISHALLDDLADTPPPPPVEAPVDDKLYGRKNAGWSLVPGGTVIDVRAYGANGDGVTDDTAAIQAAIAAAATLGKSILIPAGTFRITQLIYTSGLTGIIGSGQFATILKRIDSDPAVHYLIQNNNIAVDGVCVSNLTLDGNRANNTLAGAGMVIQGCSRIFIEDVTVKENTAVPSYGWGIYIKGNTDAATGSRSLLRRVTSSSNGNSGLSLVTAASDLDIVDCVFSNNTTHGMSTDSTASVAGAFARISVRGCTAKNNGMSGLCLAGIRAGFNFDLVQDCTIADSIAVGNAIYGIVWQGTNGTISNNIARGNGNYTPFPCAGILANAVRSVFSGNALSYNRIWGIDAGGAQYCTFTGNHFERNYNDNPNNSSGSGMNMGAAFGCLIEGNDFLMNGEAPGNGGGSNLGMKPYDGGGPYPMFPVIGRENSVLNNLFTITPGSTAFGVIISADGRGHVIQGNTFKGFSSSWRCIYNASQSIKVSGNRSLDAVTGESFAAAATMVIPAVAETLVLSGSAANIASIIARSTSDFIGKVVAVSNNAPGTGYTSTPTATISGDGTGATVTVYLDGIGGIGGYTVTNGGSGYTTATISLSGGGGTGASGTVQVGYPNAADGQTLRLVNRSGATQTLVNGTTIRLGGSNLAIPNNAAVTLLGDNGGWVLSQPAGLPISGGALTGALTVGTGTLTVGTSGTNNALIMTPGPATNNNVSLTVSGTGSIVAVPGLQLQSSLLLGTNTSNISFTFNGVNGAARPFNWQTANSTRMQMSVQGTESTGNAGANWILTCFDDSAVSMGAAITVTRATRAVTFGTGIGAFGTTPPSAKPTVSGAKGSNAALASLITALANYGLITDSTTA